MIFSFFENITGPFLFGSLYQKGTGNILNFLWIIRQMSTAKLLRYEIVGRVKKRSFQPSALKSCVILRRSHLPDDPFLFIWKCMPDNNNRHL